MRARLQTVVDCTAGPATVAVEGDIYDDGGSELDADLFRAMVKTQRGLADEARREQERSLVHSNGSGPAATTDGLRLARLVPGLLEDRARMRRALETIERRQDLPEATRELAHAALEGVPAEGGDRAAEEARTLAVGIAG